nr:hypothetical protein [Tanacetum cinerariifolium]
NLLTREAQALSVEVFRLRGEVEALKEKLDLANQERTSIGRDFSLMLLKGSFIVIILVLLLLIFRRKLCLWVGVKLASSGIGVELVDMKDFDPNAEQNYDKAIKSFDQVKFPYVDLLVYYAGHSVGKLMSLKPSIISFGNASAAGPSASHFL